MKRIIELSENDYKALKEDGVENHLVLADTIIDHSVIYEERSQDCSDCKRYDSPYFEVKFDKEQMQELVDKAKAEVLASIERSQSEWIPVSERLPEEKINPYTNDFDEVLCTTDWGEVQAFKFGTPIIHHKPHFWLGGAIMDEHIIAWQYKPEPYKEGGAE